MTEIFFSYTIKGMKKPKRGRPPKEADRLRSEPMLVRLEATEKEAFRDAADLAGVPLSTWVRERLRQIAVTRCLMHLRSPWHRARLSFSGTHEEMTPVSGPAPESLDMDRALNSLSTTARTGIWLYEVEGYSHEEIAQAFGRTVSFSKSQVARAHSRLRAWFDVNPEKVSCTAIF